MEVDEQGIAKVVLNRKYPLGEKGTVLHLPKDKVIFESVIRRGRWESKESDFLVTQFNSGKVEFDSTCLLDIGANSGLFSIQVYNKLKAKLNYCLLEPLPINLSCLRKNLDGLDVGANFNVFPFGIGRTEKMATLYTEINNIGNSSFIQSAMEGKRYFSTNLEIRNATSFALENLLGYKLFLIKSDLQGMDAEVLSLLPSKIWKSTLAASIEVYANPEVCHQDVDYLIANWASDYKLTWAESPDVEISLEHVEKFWKSGSLEQRNLRLSRTDSSF